MSSPALDSNSQEWAKIIGSRTAEEMRKETVVKFAKDKKTSNIYQRLVFLQKLFSQKMGAGVAADDEKQNDGNESADKEVHFYKPIEEPMNVVRGSTKLVDETDGLYTVSGAADLSVECGFALTGNGKYYYEVQLTEDPNSYKDLSIGFANSEHSAREEVGHDGGSYGWNGVKSKAYHMDTSYGITKWKTGDVLGFAVALDDASTKIEFYLNGESQGVAFDGAQIEYSGNGLFAGFTLQKGQSGVFIFNESKLKNTKPAGYACIADAIDVKEDGVFEVSGELKLAAVDQGIEMTAEEGFPTAVFKAKELGKGGKYYFEFEMASGGCMQLGFCDSAFQADADSGEGIGDDEHSWGFDLMRLRKWGKFGSRYGGDTGAWNSGDVIGCCLDLGAKTISYSLNGADLGVAFSDVNVAKGLSPAVSVRNVPARKVLIEYYTKKRANPKDDSITEPAETAYFNLMFDDKGYKHQPDGYTAITSTAAYQAKGICDALKEYSYAQYKEDYQFMDTVIMLQRDEEFDEISKAVDKDTLIVCDFWASWCGPCLYIAPHYHEISEKYRNVVFLKADVDKLGKLSQEKGIQCMPTFKFFKNGEEVHKLEGANKDGIIAAVEKYQ